MLGRVGHLRIPSPVLRAPMGDVRPVLALAAGLLWTLLCFVLLVVLIPAHSIEGAIFRVLVLALPLGLLWLLYAAGGGGTKAITALLVVIVIVSDLSLRRRDLSDTSLDPQNVVKLAIWGLGLLVAVINWKDLKRALREPPVLCFALFALWAMVTAAYSPIRTYTFGAAFALLAVILFGAVARQRCDDSTLLKGVVGGLGALLWLSLALYILAPDRAMAPMEGGTILRLAAPFGTPNSLGRASALVLLLLMVAYMSQVVNYRSVVFYFGGLPAVLCLVLSQSRTAMAALALSMAVILVMRYPVRVLVAGIAVAAAMLLYVLLDLDTIAIAEQISRTGRAQEVFTLTGRTRIWSFYFEQIGEAPFFGYGYASTKYLMPLLYRNYWGWTTTHAHNMWIQVLFTTGLVGLALLTAVLIAQLRSWLRTKDPLTLVMLVFVCVIGLAEAGHLAAAAPSLLTVVWAVWIVGQSKPAQQSRGLANGRAVATVTTSPTVVAART